MKNVLFLLLGIVIFTTACQTNTELTDAEKDAIVQDIKQASQKWYAEMTDPYDNETWDKWMKVMDENSTQIWQTEPVVMSLGINLYKSVSELQNRMISIIDSRISTTFTILESHYSVLTREKVLEVIKGEYFVTHKDSTDSPLYIGINTTLWANINGEWKTQYNHQSWARKPE